MTSLNVAGSPLLQELAGRSSSQRGEEQPRTGPTRAGLAALRRINSNVRRSHAWQQRATDVPNQGE